MTKEMKKTNETKVMKETKETMKETKEMMETKMMKETREAMMETMVTKETQEMEKKRRKQRERRQRAKAAETPQPVVEDTTVALIAATIERASPQLEHEDIEVRDACSDRPGESILLRVAKWFWHTLDALTASDAAPRLSRDASTAPWNDRDCRASHGQQQETAQS